MRRFARFRRAHLTPALVFRFGESVLAHPRQSVCPCESCHHVSRPIIFWAVTADFPSLAMATRSDSSRIIFIISVWAARYDFAGAFCEFADSADDTNPIHPTSGIRRCMFPPRIEFQIFLDITRKLNFSNCSQHRVAPPLTHDDCASRAKSDEAKPYY